MRKLPLFVTAQALFLAAPLLGQAPSNTVAQTYFNVPKPGAPYEAGRKKHMAWHKSQKDTWSWHVWQVLSGDATGAYISGTLGHDWKDFDGREQFDAADVADANANLTPNLVSNNMAFWVYRADLSLTPEPSTPAPMATATHYFVRLERISDFQEAIKKINSAVKKANYPAPPSRWYLLASGGTGPHFVLIADRKSYADFKPPDKPLPEMLADVYGKQEADALLDSFRKGVDHTYTETLRYRPDLSYVPAK